jgi:hypothetical protein
MASSLGVQNNVVVRQTTGWTSATGRSNGIALVFRDCDEGIDEWLQ